MIELKSNDYLQWISSLVLKLFKIMDRVLFMKFTKSSLTLPSIAADLASLTDIKKTWSSVTRPGQQFFSFLITSSFTSSRLASSSFRIISHLLHRNRAQLDWNSCSKGVFWLPCERSFLSKNQSNIYKKQCSVIMNFLPIIISVNRFEFFKRASSFSNYK